MPCFHPLKGYRSKSVSSNGKRPIVFKSNLGLIDMPVSVPCGQCNGCRLERSRQWAIRCMHEASLHEKNSFITLTYNNEHLPVDGSLDVRHYQKFMKRLRDKIFKQPGVMNVKENSKVRFYHCGEYGEKTQRPHYHACLFGFDFPDRKLHTNSNGNNLYTSKILSGLWPFGFSLIGDVTFQSAAYVSRYIMKKVTGEQAEKHYQKIDPQTGEITNLKPEYTTMSRRPGIGKLWYNKFQSDVYPHDYVVVNGKKMKPPKYYDRQFEIDDELEFKKVKAKRISASKKHLDNQTSSRLRVREKCLDAKLTKLKRNLKEDDYYDK